MADRSAIEWTEATWNPVTGCDKVSPGCDHCYALTLAKRLKAMGSAKYQRDGDPRTSGPGFGVTVHDGDTLTLPLRWSSPARVFVNSMSDLFHPRVPDEFIARMFAVMGLAGRHTFQVLTKRPARMRALLTRPDFAAAVGEHGTGLIGSRRWRRGQLNVDRWSATRVGRETLWSPPWPLPHLWLGVSVESVEYVTRVDALRRVPAAVRFLSAEPLLGPLDGVDLTGIGWVIIGGESGPGARPMDPGWAQSLVDQCRDAGVPVFVKQLGSRFGRRHHDIGIFPPSLRVREYPEAVTVA